MLLRTQMQRQHLCRGIWMLGGFLMQVTSVRVVSSLHGQSLVPLPTTGDHWVLCLKAAGLARMAFWVTLILLHGPFE